MQRKKLLLAASVVFLGLEEAIFFLIIILKVYNSGQRFKLQEKNLTLDYNVVENNKIQSIEKLFRGDVHVKVQKVNDCKFLFFGNFIKSGSKIIDKVFKVSARVPINYSTNSVMALTINFNPKAFIVCSCNTKVISKMEFDLFSYVKSHPTCIV